jgi:hypothetical protein
MEPKLFFCVGNNLALINEVKAFNPICVPNCSAFLFTFFGLLETERRQIGVVFIDVTPNIFPITLENVVNALASVPTQFSGSASIVLNFSSEGVLKIYESYFKNQRIPVELVLNYKPKVAADSYLN